MSERELQKAAKHRTLTLMEWMERCQIAERRLQEARRLLGRWNTISVAKAERQLRIETRAFLEEVSDE